ncbi:hypothetical protein [Dichotomicrobium thermohalophilum]|uniref:LysM domain-containing protein n=1 Tax=Dichotomicrobium thermohalophilum TaxID=933063 RepID=A0A397Q5U9_9HYPH|nr:hypothetical protein [Dichotomicrobium thermohalophilum]RIA56333.1 hypothetical protein BXY53_1437 [Dichotomicrobium thermohalophilum]
MKPKTITGIAAIGALAAAVGTSWTQPASAAIRCEGNFQITEYGRINTPYCEDNYLAQVAREYGMSVSASAIRRNPGVKERACRLVGHDNRVRDTCAPYLPENNRRFYFR